MPCLYKRSLYKCTVAEGNTMSYGFIVKSHNMAEEDLDYNMFISQQLMI